MDVFNAFKGIEDDISEAVEGAMPRQAVVTRPGNPSGVWVRFAPVNSTAPEMWFPSTVCGVPAGTRGWVISLAGGKGLFVATNIAIPIPFSARGPAISNTTNISSLNWVPGESITVPAGTYQVTAAATIPTRKSSSGGAIWAAIRIGGAESEEEGAGLSGTGISPGEWFPIGLSMSGSTFTTVTGDVLIEFGFRGATTAGTTSIAHATMTGTLTRIG